MNKEIKIGDLVETCSLMPGVVMKLQGDDIQVRMLHVDEYNSNDYAHCSLKHCGIVKLTAQEALERLTLGVNKLTVIWRSLNDCPDDDIGAEYHKRIKNAISRNHQALSDEAFTNAYVNLYNQVNDNRQNHQVNDTTVG